MYVSYLQPYIYVIYSWPDMYVSYLQPYIYLIYSLA